MRKKTAARVLAVQALYQWDLRGREFLAEVESFFRDAARSPQDAEVALELFSGCVAHCSEIDARLAAVAEHWDLTRMAAVDRAILRLGAYELLYCPDMPPKVALDEAIRLAKKFSTAGSSAFVNGILDRIMAAGSASVPKGSADA